MTMGSVGSNHFTVHPERSKDIAYSSLVQDEQARFSHPHTMPKVGRDHLGPPPNGNMRVVVPDIDKDEVRGHLSPYQLVNTTTRTVFNTDRVYDVHDSMYDKVSSPTFRNSVLKASGHVSMDSMAVSDPRQQHMPPPTSVELGPGRYDADALQRTGSPEAWAMNQSHVTLPLHKDPGRPSAAFKSPARNETMDEINMSKRQEGQPTYFLPPDYASWTAKGMHMSRGSRVIQAERWGYSLREPRPPPDEMSQTMEDLQIDKSGHAATCAAYAADPTSQGAVASFQSGQVRTLARHAHRKQDTRLKVQSWDKITASGTGAGPGSFNTDVVRFKSHHKALQSSRGYIQQGESVFPDGKVVRIHTAPSGSHTASCLTSPTSPSLRHPLATAASYPASPTYYCPLALPPELKEALSSPLLSPQVRPVAPWADTPTNGGLPSPSIASPLASPSRSIPAHPTMLGDLLPNAPQPLPEPKHSTSGRSKLDVNVLLDHDWAVHSYVVAAAYANVDELRGAATTGHTALTGPPARLAALSPRQGSIAALSPRQGSVTAQLPVSDDLQGKGMQPRMGSAPGLIRKQAASIWEGDGTALKLLEAQLQDQGRNNSWGGRSRGMDTSRWLQVPDDEDKFTSGNYMSTAPASPTIWSPQAAQLAAFNESRQFGIPLEINTRLPGDETLTFLRRNRPHKELIKQQLRAIGELRAERKKVKEADALLVS